MTCAAYTWLCFLFYIRLNVRQGFTLGWNCLLTLNGYYSMIKLVSNLYSFPEIFGG